MNMKKLNPHGVALVVGSTFGLMHLVWSVIVMLGFAQGLLDFVFSLHFLSNPYVLQPFDAARALMLVVMTFAVGYVLGWLFTCIWNMMMKK
jgi:hypothetical protein